MTPAERTVLVDLLAAAEALRDVSDSEGNGDDARREAAPALLAAEKLLEQQETES